MIGLGRLLITFGAILVVAGIVVILAGKSHIPLGRLPGDISFHTKSTSVYIPLMTCIVISIILSLILWVVNRFSR